MLCSLVAVGGLGTTRQGGSFTQSVGIAIVVFTYINIVFFNFSIGTLSYLRWQLVGTETRLLPVLWGSSSSPSG